MDLEREKKIARLQAEQIVLRAQFARHRPPQLDGGDQRQQLYDEFAGDELAARLRLSPGVGSRLLLTAVRAVRRMPAAVVALSHAIIDLERLEALVRATANLEDDQVDSVASSVIRDEGGCASHSAFRAAVRRQVMRIDPEGAQRRRKKAEATRRLGLRSEEDGMARLNVLMPSDRMLAAFNRVDKIARKVGEPDDERNLDQRRADVLYDLLMGQDRDSVQVEMQVIVPVDCLLGLSDNPGVVPGFGPLPAEIVREMANNPNCTWRRILTDPAEGSVQEVSSQRYPSAALRRFVQSRNPTCIFPGCDMPSTQCDLDHVCPHREGGATSAGNLAPECRRHHRLKHRPETPSAQEPGGAVAGPRWQLRQVKPGHFVWTSPEGERYDVGPERFSNN